MFSGRQGELKRLGALYTSGKFEFVVIHGRRRVGKTALICEFLKDRRAVYFAALETNARENLEGLTRSINLARSRDGESENLQSFRAALETIADMTENERMVLVLDDYQRLAASYRGMSALVQEMADGRFKNGKLMLIVCGPTTPLMESEVLGYDSPFYGRRTAQLEVRPFTFFEARRYYNEFSPFDIAVIYGITGGVPQYLNLMDKDLPIEENVRRNFFDPSSYMFEEPQNFLRQEVREPALYNAVLRAIAKGCIRNSEIAEAVELETSACTAYLKNLAALGIVAKQTPVAEQSARKTVYTIEDSMFRFWYRFVPDNMSLIQGGMADKIWRSVASRMPEFLSGVFEDICRQWLVQENAAGRLPINFVDIGRWWGIDPATRREAEVAILAYSDDDNAIFAECRWTDELVEVEALDTLIARSEMFRYRNKHLYLFTRAGFSERCAIKAEFAGAHLVVFE